MVINIAAVAVAKPLWGQRASREPFTALEGDACLRPFADAVTFCKDPLGDKQRPSSTASTG